jgi:Bacterial PH domain
MITSEQTARERGRLPRGWGRFSKAVDHLVEISDPDETLLSTCVALNPTFKHRTVTLAGGLIELTDATNVVIAATDQRLVVVATGAAGGPRGHYAIPYAGLEIADHSKKDLTLRWPDGEIHFRGAAKQQLPELLAAITAQLSS